MSRRIATARPSVARLSVAAALIAAFSVTAAQSAVEPAPHDAGPVKGWTAVAGLSGPAVLALARTLPVASEADGDQPWCDRSATVRDALRTEFEEQMVTRHSDGTQLWGSDVMGTWTVVLSRPDDTQCVIASGIGYAAGENPATYLAKVGLG